MACGFATHHVKPVVCESVNTGTPDRSRYGQPWNNHSFQVVPGLYLEGQQYRVDTALGDGDVQIQDVRFDVTASYEVAEGARVSLSVGANFGGEYDLEKRGSKNGSGTNPA